MEMNNHTFIDILKIDIEGGEFDALASLIDAYPAARDPSAPGNGLPFGQLQLEIHARDEAQSAFPRFLEWWERLEQAGLRPFWTEPNLVYLNIWRGSRPDLTEVRGSDFGGRTRTLLTCLPACSIRSSTSGESTSSFLTIICDAIISFNPMPSLAHTIVSSQDQASLNGLGSLRALEAQAGQERVVCLSELMTRHTRLL